MEIHQSIQKLKDAGLYAKNIKDEIIGGTHFTNSGSGIRVLQGYFSLAKEDDYILITLTKNSLEEATQFLKGNIKSDNNETITQLENGYVLITISKKSLEEATQFIIDNIKPGVSDELEQWPTGPREY
jgi:hypothetical protein